MARGLTPPASRASRRHYSPKELAAALATLGGIQLGERAIQKRCALPPGDPARIATNPAHPGRDWIPESELVRLLGGDATEAAA